MTRIMIDGRNLTLENGTGVATYARNLSYCLHNMGYQVEILYGHSSSFNKSRLISEVSFFDTDNTKSKKNVSFFYSIKNTLKYPFNYNAYKVPVTKTVIKDCFANSIPYYDDLYNSTNIFVNSHGSFEIFKRIKKVKLLSNPDIMHWTYPLPLKIDKVPNIYTLHDLVPLRLPYTTLDNKRIYYKLLSKIVNSSDHIVTVSEASKRDLIDILKIQHDKITNTYQYIRIPDKYLNKPPEVVRQEIEGTFCLDYKGYFIFWGAIEPKKNIGRIIEGYLASNVKAPLVIVGAKAWKSEKELKLLNDDNKVRVKQRVVQINYVPFSLLVSLIMGAKATLFPSLYEGFGLPVLESMSLGTPVITANTSSLPEVAGDAAVLVNPYDPDDIARAIRSLDGDEAWRENLSILGRAQAAKFSERAYIERLSHVYKRFMS